MAYVAPNSTVQLFGDINLSDNYHDSLYFPDTATKDSYFDALPKLANAPAMSYTREQRGYVRIQRYMSDVYTARYMRYKNTSFENKWFYAFVKDVEYINNMCTQINFELDPLMTWMGEFNNHLAQCFVERQHSTTDAVGDNIVEENLDIGDYVYNSISRSNKLGSTYTIIIGASVDQNGNNITGGEMVNNIYSGIALHQFGTKEAANSWIAQLTADAKSNAIVACVMCPSKFITDQQAVTEVFTVPKNLSYIDGYAPRNKKLFTYPYNYLVVTNGEGNFATFRYEFWRASSTNCSFSIGGVAGLEPEVVLTPSQYKGSAQNLFNYAEKIVLNGFPHCAFNIDQYKAFLAQNWSTVQFEGASTLASGVLNTVTGFVTGGLSGGVREGMHAAKEIGSIMAFHNDYKRKPTQANGNTTTNFASSRREKDFWFLKQSITREYAAIIDDYFTMFGYAQKCVMTPNMNARPNYTYVKTVGCEVGGAIPADDASAIETIFDNGIRFWKNHSNIGNYSVNNDPS